MEALIKLTNRELKTIVNERLFTKEALSKFIYIIWRYNEQSTSNSMPASDKFDKLEPVMPNYFLLGKSSPNWENWRKKKVRGRFKYQYEIETLH